jgi:hypothetical protein
VFILGTRAAIVEDMILSAAAAAICLFNVSLMSSDLN